MPKPTVRIASFLLPGPGQVRKRRALAGNPVKSYGADPAPGVSVDLDETAPYRPLFQHSECRLSYFSSTEVRPRPLSLTNLELLTSRTSNTGIL